jgi:hypothetical protein
MGETFFKRNPKLTHGLTEEQLIEAFNIYQKKIDNEVFEEVKAEYGVELEDGETKDFLKVFISKGVTKGMELVSDTSIVTDYYKQVKEIKTDDRCGVIDNSDNIFYPCMLGEHWKTISNILEEKYPDLYEPFVELMHVKRGEDEFEGVTRTQLDRFIMNNFKLIGELRVLDEYLNEARR